MKATITSKGQVTIPVGIRERLGLRTGQVLEFDPTSPFIKAVPVFDEDEMHSVVGCAKGRLGRSSQDWLDETRGPAEPAKAPRGRPRWTRQSCWRSSMTNPMPTPG